MIITNNCLLLTVDECFLNIKNANCLRRERVFSFGWNISRCFIKQLILYNSYLLYKSQNKWANSNNIVFLAFCFGWRMYIRFYIKTDNKLRFICFFSQNDQFSTTFLRFLQDLPPPFFYNKWTSRNDVAIWLIWKKQIIPSFSRKKKPQTIVLEVRY